MRYKKNCRAERKYPRKDKHWRELSAQSWGSDLTGEDVVAAHMAEKSASWPGPEPVLSFWKSKKQSIGAQVNCARGWGWGQVVRPAGAQRESGTTAGGRPGTPTAYVAVSWEGISRLSRGCKVTEQLCVLGVQLGRTTLELLSHIPLPKDRAPEPLRETLPPPVSFQCCLLKNLILSCS